MKTGTVARLVLDKGFGFIRDDSGIEHFFHRSSVLDRDLFEQLREGMTVTFDEVASPKGARAERVRIE